MLSPLLKENPRPGGHFKEEIIEFVENQSIIHKASSITYNTIKNLPKK